MRGAVTAEVQTANLAFQKMEKKKKVYYSINKELQSTTPSSTSN